MQAALLAELPTEFGASAAIFRRALCDTAFTGWMIWPVSDAVASRAVRPGRAEDFQDGLALLAELIGEFALRTFLAADLDGTLRTVLTWTAHEDEHVRRLASEGTGPRLPWARRVPGLMRRPAATLPILDALFRDEAEYVRRSVANHLNDISRIDSGLAVEAAAGWLRAGDENSLRLVKRALRTLVKDADPDALALFGFAPPRDIEVDGPRLGSPTVSVGESLSFAATIANAGNAPCAS